MSRIKKILDKILEQELAGQHVEYSELPGDIEYTQYVDYLTFEQLIEDMRERDAQLESEEYNFEE